MRRQRLKSVLCAVVEAVEARRLYSSFEFTDAVDFTATQPVGYVAVAQASDTPGAVTVAVAGLSQDRKVSVLVGIGDGHFEPGLVQDVGGQPYCVALADINGDHRVDLITANQDYSTVTVLRGHGDGTFDQRVEGQSDFAVGLRPKCVVVADVNGDGHPDILTANVVYGTISVLLGDGNGGFTRVSPDRSAGGGNPDGPQSIALGDFNNDNVPDLVIAPFNRTNVTVLFGIGDGHFKSKKTFEVGGNPFSVVVGDFNHDGNKDIACTELNQNKVSVLLGSGDGGFNAHADYDAGRYPHSIRVGDIDGDDVDDLVVANVDDDTVNVLLGTGDGTFDAGVPLDAGEAPNVAIPVDVNGDGLDDIVTSNTHGNSVGVRLNLARTAVLGTDPNVELVLNDIKISGTANPDDVKIDGTDEGLTVRVRIGTLIDMSFPRSEVSKIHARLGGGADTVQVGEFGLPVDLPMVIEGGAGADFLEGGTGNDIIDGGRGPDTLSGFAGDDSIHGGRGSDNLEGRGGNDRLFGDAGRDTIVAGAGNDFLRGGAGSDVMNGGADNDEFDAVDQNPGDTLDGVSGNDFGQADLGDVAQNIPNLQRV